MGPSDSNSAVATIRCKGGDAVHRMVEAAQAFGIARALDPSHAARLSIIIEELVFNLVDHGGLSEDGEIELVLRHEEGVVGITLTDTGAAFDPRAAESGEDIPERGGGAGINLVRAWAEIVDYGPHAGRNRLLLKMWLS